MAASNTLRVAVDIGGTFTDVVAIRGGKVAATKVLSTPADLSRGVVDGIDIAIAQLGAMACDIDFVVHATTAATNALLQRRGARVGLIVTDGFRDILEIGRQRRFNPYDLRRPKLAPLVPRDMVVEVAQRIDAAGKTLIELDEDAVRAAYHYLHDKGADAIAVSFLHAYCNPEHEQRALDLIGIERGATSSSDFASHQVVAEAREFERTSTTIIAAYLAPVVKDYLEALAQRLAAMGAPRVFWVMKSSGGLLSCDAAQAHPEELVESGPAAGVIGAAAGAREIGVLDIISFDMGGTTAKAALIKDGVAQLNYEYEVGGAAHAGGFLQKGTGYPLRIPVIDLAEVGTGGGSIAWVDRGGALRIGPQSAGASPGPVCYALGGVEPTVTDADLVLGYLHETGSAQFLGRVDLDAARAAIETQVAGPLSMTVEAAARGIFDLANAQMADAVRLVSVAKGFDPRELTLVAFGGAGPIHAWAIARELSINKILIPPYPGVYSAIGLLGADFRFDLSRGTRIRLAHADADTQLGAVIDSLALEARAAMHAQGHKPEAVLLTSSADMRYLGQSYEVNVTFDSPSNNTVDAAQLHRAFNTEHARVYGHASASESVEIITLRMTARVKGGQLDFESAGDSMQQASSEVRDVSFDGVLTPTRVVTPTAIDTAMAGPVAVEQADTTIIVPPGARVLPSSNGFLLIELESPSS
ncbi:MAG: N-methylhydantoinase A [Gammaproteobacteria bacterium]|jgi:N-methylhydantoinase A